jgi:hypothetical protein
LLVRRQHRRICQAQQQDQKEDMCTGDEAEQTAALHGSAGEKRAAHAGIRNEERLPPLRAPGTKPRHARGKTLETRKKFRSMKLMDDLGMVSTALGDRVQA